MLKLEFDHKLPKGETTLLCHEQFLYFYNELQQAKEEIRYWGLPNGNTLLECPFGFVYRLERKMAEELTHQHEDKGE